MMRRFDPDTIAALAEGRLAPSDAAALEAAIAADPKAAAELARQRLALTALRGALRPSLTASERSLLRCAVASALGVEDGAMAGERTVAATEAGVRLIPPRPRRVPWGAIGIAAASLAALVLAVPAADLLSFGGDDSAAGTTVAEASIAVAAEETDAVERTGETTSGAALPEADMQVSEAGATTSTTTAAEATTTAAIPTSSIDPLQAALIDELLALRSDPDRLATFTAAALPDAACSEEAGALLVDTEFGHFEYPLTEENGGDTGYVVYFVLPPETDPIGTLYAFPIDDCASPLEIP